MTPAPAPRREGQEGPARGRLAQADMAAFHLRPASADAVVSFTP
jgi:hypothetical protein